MAAKKKKKKTPAYKTEAKKLANAQYAGTIEQLLRNKGTNRRQYDEYAVQRQESLGKQIASDRVATEITGNVISGLKGQAMEGYARSNANNDAARQLRDQATSAANSNALANYEAEMKARGITAPQAAAMKGNLETQQGFTKGVDAIEQSYQGANQKIAEQTFDTQKIRSAQLGNVFEANAKATATQDFNEKYNTYTQKRDDYAAEIAKAKLDRGATYLNTYMTLKKEAQQRAAEKAASQLSAAVAQGKQASSDYFRQLGADQAQQRIDISKQGASLNQDKFLASLQKDVYNGKISGVKAVASLNKQGMPVPQWLNDIIAAKPESAKKNYKYYDPRKGTYTTSRS